MKFNRATGAVVTLAAALGLAACGGGGGGGSTQAGGTLPVPTTVTPTPPPNPGQIPSTTSGIAYLPGGTSVTAQDAMQVIQYEDTMGNVLAAPLFRRYSATGEIGQIAASADGSVAVVADKTPTGIDFTQIESASLAYGQFAFTGFPALDVTQAAGIVRGIAVSPDGSMVAVQGDNSDNATVAVSGISTGTPAVFARFTPAPTQIPVGELKIAVAFSPDDKTVVSRGDVTSFYAMTSTGNPASPMTFALAADKPDIKGSFGGGRGAMAFDPRDGSRMLFGAAPLVGDVTLVTGMPQSPNETAKLTLPVSAAIQSVAFTPNGSYAVVGSTAGLFILNGMSSGSLSIVPQGGSSNYVGSFAASDGSKHDVTQVSSVGVSGDGKFVAAIVTYTIGAAGTPESALLVIPIGPAGSLGAIAAVVAGVNNGTQNIDPNLFR